MIVETAILYIIPAKAAAFPLDFAKAAKYIAQIEGFIKVQLLKCIEVENKYTLIVHWQTVESHTVGFRKSEQYIKWKELLHHYYNPFPVVEHYEVIL